LGVEVEMAVVAGSLDDLEATRLALTLTTKRAEDAERQIAEGRRDRLYEEAEIAALVKTIEILSSRLSAFLENQR